MKPALLLVDICSCNKFVILFWNMHTGIQCWFWEERACILYKLGYKGYLQVFKISAIGTIYVSIQKMSFSSSLRRLSKLKYYNYSYLKYKQMPLPCASINKGPATYVNQICDKRNFNVIAIYIRNNLFIQAWSLVNRGFCTIRWYIKFPE